MDERMKCKIKAAVKIGFGVGKGVSAIMLGTGHGILGGFCRSHHMMVAAAKMAKQNLASAGKTLEDGMREWDSA
jgi:hypothetical protein